MTVVLAYALVAALAPPRAPVPGTRVAVQPIVGDVGPSVRAQVARILRGKRFHVVTNLAAASGTARYPVIAKERRIAAFVVADLEERPTRISVTFLVWNGLDGTVTDRWTAAAHPKKLGQTIAKGFWKQLGPSLVAAKAPPSDKLRPAPPMRINAGTPIVDDAISAERE